MGVEIVSKNHLETMDTEFIGTSNVCRAARVNNVKKIIYTSTSAVYGKKHFNISPKEIENVVPVLKTFSKPILPNISSEKYG